MARSQADSGNPFAASANPPFADSTNPFAPPRIEAQSSGEGDEEATWLTTEEFETETKPRTLR